MPRQFVSERITPDPSSFDTSSMAIGEPALPRRFTWRKQTLEVHAVLRAWKEAGDCRHGSGERYVRKHWFEVRTGDGSACTLYFERQSSSRRRAKARWWIYSVRRPVA